MNITQVKPIADHMLMYRTMETGDAKYYYSAHKFKNYTEIYTWGNEDVGIIDYENYKHYVLTSYVPINPENPEISISTFWKLYMLQ